MARPMTQNQGTGTIQSEPMAVAHPSSRVQDLEDGLRLPQLTLVCHDGNTMTSSQAPRTTTTMPQDATQCFLDDITSTAAVTALTTPVQQPRRASSTTTTALRRSRRIATRSYTGTALDKAQSVLMRKMGVLQDQEPLTEEAREAYARLFQQPLSRPQITALAALFGWTVPDDCEARAADLLVL